MIDMGLLTSTNLPQKSDTANQSIIRPAIAIHLILILLIIGFPFASLARDRIVSVQSISIAPYENAINGFAEICTLPMDHLLMSDKYSLPLTEQIRYMEPKLILAVGLDALNALDDIHEIPIVFVMLLCPECKLTGRSNVTGVNMTPSVDVQLDRIRKILPDVHKVGLVFNPDHTMRFVQSATEAASPLGLDILSKPIATAREVPSRLIEIRDQVELVWMIPDVSVITQQTIEFFLLFSMENKIPLVAFSEKYVHLGALMAFGLDADDMGRQAGEMANLVLSGTRPEKLPIQDARAVSVTVNQTLAKKFGIRMDDSLRNTVKFVE